MARICDKCMNYSPEIDDFRQQYVDKIVKGENGKDQHFCPIYDDHIPTGIWYDGESCPFFNEK